MGGLVSDYYKQLNSQETLRGKHLVLRRFLKDSTGFEVNFGIIGKMIKLYGTAAVFNAIIAVNSKDFESIEDLVRYLFGVCRRTFKEEVIEEPARKRARRKPEHRSAKKLIEELHGRDKHSKE